MLNPLKLPDRLSTKVARYQIDREKVLVAEGFEVEKRLCLWAFLKVLVGMGAVIALIVVPSTAPYRVLFASILGGVVATYAFAQWRTSRAYRNGWIDGRRNAVERLSGYDDPNRWALYLAEYDLLHVLGYARTTVPDSPEGLE